MNTFTTPDSVEIFYRDWGSASRSYLAMAAIERDDWDAQMLFFLHKAFGSLPRPSRAWAIKPNGGGHDMDHYAADLAALAKHLDLKHAIHVSHSTGGGEVAAYIGRHGEAESPRQCSSGCHACNVKKDSNPAEHL